MTLDGTFLEDTPNNLYKMGDFLDVTIMIGFNKDDGTFSAYVNFPEYSYSPTPPYINRELFEYFVNMQLTRYGMDGDIVNKAVLQEYSDWSIADNATADYFTSFVNFAGDFDFAANTDEVVRAHANVGGTVYKYFMTHEPTK